MDTQHAPPSIHKSLEVNCSPDKAFKLFTSHIGEWWPLDSHSIYAHRTGNRPKTCVMEGQVGGRVFEIAEDGTEFEWGHILVWDPGKRVSWTWRLERPPEQATEVEVTFTEIGSGRTRVELEHRDWHHLGEEAPELRAGYDGGWDTVFGDKFRTFAEANT